MSNEERKSGTAWIQNLSKDEVLKELTTRGVQVTDQLRLDDLRRLLREDIKRQESVEENNKTQSQNTTNTSELAEKTDEFRNTEKKVIKMEYTH